MPPELSELKGFEAVRTSSVDTSWGAGVDTEWARCMQSDAEECFIQTILKTTGVGSMMQLSDVGGLLALSRRCGVCPLSLVR